MKKWFLLLTCCFALTVHAQKNADAGKFAQLITATELKAKLSILASEEMEGRETASEGQRKAADFIANTFKQYGLLPGNGNSYFQKYPVYQDQINQCLLKVNGIDYSLFNDFTIYTSLSTGGKIEAKEFVFAGFGIYDSVQQINDYDGLDVKNKLVFVVDGGPKDYKPTPTTGRRQAATTSLNAKAAWLRKNGALGVFLVVNKLPGNPTSLPIIGNKYIKANFNTENFFAGFITATAFNKVLKINETPEVETLATITKKTYRANIVWQVDKQVNTLESTNVVALLPGTDKKEEYVVLTGHYDHLGKRNGKIYYGADDDGSGTTAVLQMAKAFAEAQKNGKGPRRNIVFMTVSGEENGLWGSQYYSENPIFPLSKTSVNLNTDMVGRVGSDYKGDTSNYVYVIGDDKISSDLAPITDSINQTYRLELDRRYNDLNDPNRFYYRSDHFNFAKAGVPIIFYFNGVHADYHQPSDTVDKINFALMERRVKFIFLTAWAMANRNDMLKRDIPLQIPPR